MWSVGATAATEVHEGYVVLPLGVGMTWEASRAQVESQGGTWTLDQDGIDPAAFLRIEFVTATGRAFSTMDNYDAQVPNELWTIGNVYPPAESFTANYSVSVPSDQVAGGVW